MLEKLYIIFLEKKCPKTCIYQEFFVILHQILKAKKRDTTETKSV